MSALAAGNASAAITTVKLTGSTAFRKAVYAAIVHTLTNPQCAYYGNASLASAPQATFTGTLSSNAIVVQCAWSGSVGGVQTTTQNLTVKVTTSTPDTQTWLSITGNTFSAVSTTGSGSSLSFSGGTLATTPNFDAAATNDIAMSDSFQSSTAFRSPTLHNTNVGVVPFVWTKGLSNNTSVSTSLANVTNMPAIFAKVLLETGGLPLSMLTNNSADAGYFVYPMGRDEDSGTRLEAFAECGFGIFGAPLQYLPTISGGVITGISAYPVNTVNGTTYPLGHSGYASGGSLGTDLNTPVDSAATGPDGVPFALLAYFGVNDANKVNSGNNNLTFNGVPYSYNGVANGYYQFWSYEHLLYRTSLSGTAKTVADAIASQLSTSDGTVSGVLLSDMQVNRPLEGGDITPN